MRKQTKLKLWNLALETAKTSRMVIEDDGSKKWTGFKRVFRDLKKAYTPPTKRK